MNDAAPSAAPAGNAPASGGSAAPAPSGNGAAGSQTPAAPSGGSVKKAAPVVEVKPKPKAPPAPVEKPKPAEPYRFRNKLKVFGEEEDVDLDEEGIQRELQIGRGLQKRSKELDTTMKRAKRVLELAETDPEAFLREMGQDPEQYAMQRLAEKAKLETMSEGERRTYELEQENKKLKEQAEATTKAQKDAEYKATVQRQRQVNVQRFGEALKAVEEPNSYEMLYLMAEIDRERFDPELNGEPNPLYGVELTPAQLGREAMRRMETFTGRYFKAHDGAGIDKKFGKHIDAALDSFQKPHPTKEGEFVPDGAALAKRLGSARVQAILEAELASYEASQSFEPKPNEPPPPPKPAQDEAPEVIDPYEVDRRLKEMRNKGVPK